MRGGVSDGSPRRAGVLAMAFCLALAVAANGAGAATRTSSARRTAAGSADSGSNYEWTRSPAGAAGLGNVNGLATDGKTFVVIGLNRNSGPGAPIWASSDGAVWKQAQGSAADFPSGTIVTKIAFDRDKFVAFGRPAPDQGNATLAWSSSNGKRWVKYKGSGFAVPAGYRPESLSATKDGLVLLVVNPDVGYALWRSHGNRWQSVGDVVLAGGPSAVINQVVASGSRFTAAGRLNNIAAAWASPDGSQWSAGTINELGVSTFSSIEGLVMLGGRFVGVGVANYPGTEIGAAWSSPDGAEWTPSDGTTEFVSNESGTSAGLLVATVAGGTVVAAGSDGSHVALWTSRNGSTWKRATDDPQLAVRSGTSAEPTGVAVANGHVAVTFREYGSSNDLVGLGIVSGTIRR